MSNHNGVPAVPATLISRDESELVTGEADSRKPSAVSDFTGRSGSPR